MTTDQSKPDGGWTPPPGHATDEEENAVAAPASPTQPASTEVATRPARAPVHLGARQTEFDPMYRLAQNLAQSDLLPKDLKGKPANVLIIMMYGQELNLSPVQSLQGIYVVNGRPSMSGQLWFSLIRKAGHRISVDEHTDQKCTVTITRGDSGESHTETFTWEDGKRAGLTNKDVWKSWPKRMLLWRAGTSCATIICPEVAMGFDLQGAEHVESEPVRPSLAEVAANRRADPDPEKDPEGYAEKYLHGAEATAFLRGKPVQDVTDAEFVDEPTPHADELAQLAEDYQGGQQDTGLFGEQGWPEVRQPGSGG